MERKPNGGDYLYAQGAYYLPGFDSALLQRLFEHLYPHLADTLWLDRPNGLDELQRVGGVVAEFETDAGPGRGDSYREAQRAVSARLVGIETLLRLATGCDRLDNAPVGFRLLDVLGGDGLIARATRRLQDGPRLSVLTSDLAGTMVVHALAQGLPAVRQPAQFLLQQDDSFDAVLLAYGTHHIEVEERPGAVQEAFRVLHRGGRIVLHDFEADSPMDRWFAEIVHQWSPAGHLHPHFTRSELCGYLNDAGFEDVAVRDVYDPIVLTGADRYEAVDRLLDYLIAMYGLRGIEERGETGRVELVAWIEEHMRYEFAGPPGEPQGVGRLTVTQEVPGRWRAEFPRYALVATGVKRSHEERVS
jgi:SAM-dependent methyltransferase